MKFINIILLFIFISSTAAYADWNPGGIKAAPAGTKGMLTYFRHYSANKKYSNGKKISENETFDANITIFRPIFWFEKSDILFAPQILQPVGSKSYGSTYNMGQKFDIDQSDSGIGDTTFALGIWPYYNFSSKTFFLIQLYLTAPTGDYNKEKTINMGENRWQYKAETGFFKKIPETNLSVEWGAGICFYGDNDKYSSKGLNMEQEETFSTQLSFIYDLTEIHDIAITGFYENEGETTVNKIHDKDKNKKYSAQISWGWGITKNTQLFLKYKKDIDVNDGLKKDITALRWTYLF
jgi:hypothetical protein